jgi:hypothetical protein
MRDVEHPTIHALSYLSEDIQPVSDQKWFRDNNSGYVELADYHDLLKRYHARGRRIKALKALKVKLCNLLRERVAT